MTLKINTIERIRLSSIIDQESGCWDWQGYVTPQGYGLFSLGNKTKQVHRASYEAFVGQIPDGFTIDHLCFNKRCVNPYHMETVTRGVNVLRGDTITGNNARKTHCLRGHPLSGSNLYIYRGLRVCRACNKIASQERRDAYRMLTTERCACGCDGRPLKGSRWLRGHYPKTISANLEGNDE